MAMSFEHCLLELGREYETSAKRLKGRSLARVATIVANRGSFFDALESGSTCSLRNFARFVDFFQDRTNWPGEHIPPKAVALLTTIVRDPSDGLPAGDLPNVATGDRAA